MKRIALLVVAALLLIAVPAAAQISLNYTTALNAVAYAASENDTGTVAGQYVAGAKLLVLWVSCTDSAAFDITVQYKRNGTWTTVVTDSLITTTDTGAEQEYSIRDTDSDATDGIVYPLRVVVAARATGNGVTSPAVTARWYYRP